MSGSSALGDRVLAVTRTLAFLGAGLCIVAIFFPMTPETGGAYTWTYPDGTVAEPVATETGHAPNFGDVVYWIVNAIFMLALGMALGALRRIEFIVSSWEAR